MYAKLQITGDIELKTGMHIGGSSAFAAIGAVDSPVIKDARTNLPMIPGSSLKGKMRALLAKEFNKAVNGPDDDAECLTRLFGSAKAIDGKVKQSRVIISDMFLSNSDKLKENGAGTVTEVKFENSINRVTAVANPRQIERAIRGSEFNLDIVYEVSDERETIEDIAILAEGLKLISYDYLGGSGSRGYGKVCFKNLEIVPVIGDISDETLDACMRELEKAENI